MISKSGAVAQPEWLWGALGAGSETFGSRANRVRYHAVDISDALDRAASRVARTGLNTALVRADLMDLPVANDAADQAFSQGVLHTTDTTEDAIAAVARKLRKCGRFMIYVYRYEGQFREFSDDYVRE